MRAPRIKVCCIAGVAEARAAVRAGADALGLVSAMPSGPGVIAESALAVKELGGTGRTHDWTLSRAIRDAVSVPVFLAGGLRAENVGDAIRAVEPFGLDLCSGVRTEGRLDEAKLDAFFDAVRWATEEVPSGA